MANKIVECGLVQAINVKDVVKVRLPFASNGEVLTFHQGDQVVAETLETGSRTIYAGALVTDATTEEPVMIINQDVYKDEYGNKHGYVVNPAKITYKSGDLIMGLRPSKNIPFMLTYDAFSQDAVVGSYLVPQVATETDSETFNLVVSATNTGAVGYKITKIAEPVPVGQNIENAVLVRTIC